MRLKAMVIVSMLFGTSCKSQDLQTVPALDLQRYGDIWYEIARLPNSFEKNLDCITATYTICPDGRVTFENKGVKADGSLSSIKGVAWVPDKDEPAKLKVRFFWPFAGKYWVVYLDQDYRYALVGEPKRKYFWILSRTPQIDPTTYNQLVDIASQKGFDTQRLFIVNQKCPE
ncbi:MAG TPA: hypothetical protein ENN49_09740 [Bacteroidales bacterium]|nr:hypothetical protein [Bacteroidales bacterium]